MENNIQNFEIPEPRTPWWVIHEYGDEVFGQKQALALEIENDEDDVSKAAKANALMEKCVLIPTITIKNERSVEENNGVVLHDSFVLIHPFNHGLEGHDQVNFAYVVNSQWFHTPESPFKMFKPFGSKDDKTHLFSKVTLKMSEIPELKLNTVGLRRLNKFMGLMATTLNAAYLSCLFSDVLKDKEEYFHLKNKHYFGPDDETPYCVGDRAYSEIAEILTSPDEMKAKYGLTVSPDGFNPNENQSHVYKCRENQTCVELVEKIIRARTNKETLPEIYQEVMQKGIKRMLALNSEVESGLAALKELIRESFKEDDDLKEKEYLEKQNAFKDSIESAINDVSVLYRRKLIELGLHAAHNLPTIIYAPHPKAASIKLPTLLTVICAKSDTERVRKDYFNSKKKFDKSPVGNGSLFWLKKPSKEDKTYEEIALLLYKLLTYSVALVIFKVLLKTIKGENEHFDDIYFGVISELETKESSLSFTGSGGLRKGNPEARNVSKEVYALSSEVINAVLFCKQVIQGNASETAIETGAIRGSHAVNYLETEIPALKGLLYAKLDELTQPETQPITQPNEEPKMFLTEIKTVVKTEVNADLPVRGYDSFLELNEKLHKAIGNNELLPYIDVSEGEGGKLVVKFVKHYHPKASKLKMNNVLAKLTNHPTVIRGVDVIHDVNPEGFWKDYVLAISALTILETYRLYLYEYKRFKNVDDLSVSIVAPQAIQEEDLNLMRQIVSTIERVEPNGWTNKDITEFVKTWIDEEFNHALQIISRVRRDNFLKCK